MKIEVIDRKGKQNLELGDIVWVDYGAGDDNDYMLLTKLPTTKKLALLDLGGKGGYHSDPVDTIEEITRSLRDHDYQVYSQSEYKLQLQKI